VHKIHGSYGYLLQRPGGHCLSDYGRKILCVIIRTAVSPVVAPPNLAKMEDFSRSHVQEILDGLPVGKEFNWVQKSII
jgi:hypothetical protein